MSDVVIFLFIAISFALVLWNNHLVLGIEGLEMEISILELEKRAVASDFRNYRFEVEKAVKNFNGGIFKLSDGKS